MKNKYLYLLLLALFVAGLWFFKNPRNLSAKTIVSGTINLNGTIPEKSTLSIGTRKIGASQFDIVASGIKVTDQAIWQWNSAENGASYEIQGYLEVNGTNIGESDIIKVTASASDEVLTFNIESHSDDNTSISGSLDINGVIPAKSSVSIVYRKKGEKAYTTAVSGIKSADGESWEWKEAKKGSVYEIKALLQLNKVTVTESKAITISAPASDEILKLNITSPTVSPQPPGSATISGSVGLNGSISGGNTIAIGERIKGQSQFNIVVTNLSATNNVNWSWNNAQAGVTYEIQAYLQKDGNNYASSEVLTVAAPAGNEALHINTSSNLPVPQFSPGVKCLGKGGNGNWNVNISYHSVNGASLYWIKVGDASQDNRYLDSFIPPNDQQLPTTYNFNTDYLFSEGVSYYTKYAYSPCGSCRNSYDFSPFTPVNQFTCTTAPAPTYTPYPTFTPQPQPTNTSTQPTPTLPPKTAKCNETCGSNGYSCVTGLQCVSGELIGSSVCRNPNCTDKIDCTCR